MKKVLSAVLPIVILVAAAFFIVPILKADAGNTYYIDSVEGDNSSKGTSSEEAWKDLEGFEDAGVQLCGGDTVLFKCGGTYECCMSLEGINSTKDAPLLFSSYGEGERPILETYEYDEVFTFIDCSYVTVSNLQITAPLGGGIWIDTINRESVGITIENVYFFGMPNGMVTNRDDLTRGAQGARAAVMVKGLPANSEYPVNDLTIRGCEVYDTANGFLIWGSRKDLQDHSSAIYNTGVLVEDCYFHEMDAEAVVIGICDGALVTHCRAINTCQGEGVDGQNKILYYTAAMWFWGSENSTIQYCEIAGQKNVGDGMAVDFDSDSNNCTYQYIYSHDNQRFIINNAKSEPQRNNTVRYCLSVNDNKGVSSLASFAGEDGLNFYNNTIVNCGEFQFHYLTNSLIANNIIIPVDGAEIKYDSENEKSSNNTYTNNCYYNTANPGCDPLSIITLPEFVGGKGTEAYKLSVNSPLIKQGYDVKKDDAKLDFYGEKIVSNNIGCYMGKGEELGAERENAFEKFTLFIKNLFN